MGALGGTLKYYSTCHEDCFMEANSADPDEMLRIAASSGSALFIII